MSGGDLSQIMPENERRDSELPVISINTGGNRLSYPQVEYTRNATENFASPY
jgi:hypothetical protein